MELKVYYYYYYYHIVYFGLLTIPCSLFGFRKICIVNIMEYLLFTGSFFLLKLISLRFISFLYLRHVFVNSWH